MCHYPLVGGHKEYDENSFYHNIFIFSYATYCQSSKSDSPHRIKRIINYQSKSFDIPDIINNSTADKFIDTEYIYSEELLVGIKRLYFRDNEELKLEYDSIEYLTKDSVSVRRWSEEGTNKFYLQLPNFLDLRDKVGEGGLRYYSNYHKILVVSSKIKNEIEYYKKKYFGDGYEDTVRLTYNFDPTHRINEIIEVRSSTDIESWYRFNYDNNKLTISTGSGEIWHTSTEYFFNDNGLLIKEGQESDTNASIVVYEYEIGSGNAISFINSIYDVIRFNPLIK